MVAGVADRIKRRLRIQQLLELGWSVGAICDQEQCSRMTVLRWKKRFEAGEQEQDRRRRGRPHKLTPAYKRQITNRAEGKCHVSTRKIAAWLRNKGVSVSKDTARRTLKEDGLKAFHRRRQQRLTEKQKRRRVLFAKQYMDFNWKRTLMTDEAEFQLVPRGNSRNDVVWARSVEDVPPIEQEGHSAAVRVWAGVSALGRTALYFLRWNSEWGEIQSAPGRSPSRDAADLWRCELDFPTRWRDSSLRQQDQRVACIQCPALDFVWTQR